MPPIDRREYLRCAGAATVGSLGVQGAGAVESSGRSQPRTVVPPVDLRTEYAEDPLGVEAFAPRLGTDATADEATGGAPDGTSSGAADGASVSSEQAAAGDGRPGADWTDYTYEARFTVENSDAGFVFRAQDEGNCYMWQVGEVVTQEGFQVYRLNPHVIENGNAQLLGSIPFVRTREVPWHDIRIELSGATIETYVDGEHVDTTEDPTFDSGTVGFRTNGTEHMLVDEVEVQDPEGETLFDTDFSYERVTYFSGGTIVDDKLSLQGSGVVLREGEDTSEDPSPPPEEGDGDEPKRPTSRPRLGWRFVPNYRGQRQSAYRVLVASTEERLADDVGDKWDSGTVQSSRSSNVEYDGEPLGSGEQVYWKVRVWDEDGRVSDWSDVATWEMGLLEEADWEADWIRSPRRTDQSKVGNRWMNYTLDVEFTLEEGKFGVVFRAQDSNNFYVAELLANGADSPTTLRVRMREHGEWRTLSEAPVVHAIPPGTDRDTHTLSIDVSRPVYAEQTHVSESTFHVSVDGQHVDTVADDTHSYGRIGFRTSEGGRARVTAVEATDPGGDVLFADDFSEETAIDYSGGEIADGELRVAGPETVLVHRFHPFVAPAPLLRTGATFEKEIEEARAYVSGLGFYELYLNGERVGDQVLDPGRTDYEGTVLYATHDVTDHLQRGENAVGVVLGRARFGETIPNLHDWHDTPWWDDPQLRFQLDVTFTDGTTTTVASGDGWRTTDGPTRYDSLMAGEVYDARRERDGWASPWYDPSAWASVETVDGPAGDLATQVVRPVSVVETRTPVERSEPKPGVHVFDVGRVVAGWAEITVEGERGDDVKLSMGEKLHDDGTVNTDNAQLPVQQQEDTYILAGDGVETWKPRFSYKGFRYVQLEGAGAPADPSLEDVEIEVVHTPIDEGVDSEFASANDLFEEVHENMRWAYKTNMQSVPTASSYEEAGWTGDALLSAETAAYNFSKERLWTKWLRDIRDAQNRAPEAGSVPQFVPHSDSYSPQPWPGWESVYPFVTWYMYQYYGDERVLREHYDGLKAYLERLGRHASGHVVYSGLGDWVAPYAGAVPGQDDAGVEGDHCAPGNPTIFQACARDGTYFAPEGPELVATAYYYRSAEILAEVAAVLGESEDAERFTSLSEEIEAAFNETFFYPEEDVYRSSVGPAGSTQAPNPQYRQTSNVFPLAFGLVPEGHEEAVVDNLVFDILVTHDGHLNTGCHGTKFLLPVLSEYGRHDVAYTVATQTTYPSWGWWMENGINNLVETWTVDSRSYNHHFLGTVDEWFYKYVAGIREPAEPGFEHVEIAPELAEDLPWARATVDTLHGPISSEWERADQRLSHDVTVPGGVTGTVRVPDLGLDGVRLREGGRVVWIDGRGTDAPGRLPAGIKDVSREDDAVVLEVGPGSYEFVLERHGG